MGLSCFSSSPPVFFSRRAANPRRHPRLTVLGSTRTSLSTRTGTPNVPSMPGISPSRHKPCTSLGERRGLSDLPCCSIDLARADTGAQSAAAARSRAYPSPPMSGSPPLPPKPTQEAGERSQAQEQYQVPSQIQDAYRGATLHQGQPEEPRGQFPPSLPPPPPLPPLPPVARPYHQPIEPPERMGYYRPVDDAAHRRLTYPLPGPSHIPPQQPAYQGVPREIGAQPTFAPTSQPAASTGASAFEPPRPARKAKGHVASACVPCKKAHLRYVCSRWMESCLPRLTWRVDVTVCIFV